MRLYNKVISSPTAAPGEGEAAEKALHREQLPGAVAHDRRPDLAAGRHNVIVNQEPIAVGVEGHAVHVQGVPLGRGSWKRVL